MADKAKKKDGGIVETIKTIVYALLIAGIFRTLFFQPFWIPSGSMKDTLLIGDFLFVNKMTYGYSSACARCSSPSRAACRPLASISMPRRSAAGSMVTTPAFSAVSPSAAMSWCSVTLSPGMISSNA